VTYKFKQFGFALCLMASLLVGHAAACTCQHPDGAETAGSSCYSHNESNENVDQSDDAAHIDDDCTCAVQQTLPFATAKPLTWDRHSADITSSDQKFAKPEFIAAAVYTEPTIFTTSDLFYVSKPAYLLPSRAPPRL
jgi:hypothetical protein